MRHGGADFDSRALSRLSSGPPLDAWAMWDMPAGVGFPVMALAQVSNHGCHFANGPLTAWDSQSHLQLVMHGHPADAYSVAVDDLRQASGPLALQMKRSTNARQSCMSGISATQPLFRGAWGAGAGGVGAHDAGAVRLLRGVCPVGSRTSHAAPPDTVSAKALLRAWEGVLQLRTSRCCCCLSPSHTCSRSVPGAVSCCWHAGIGRSTCTGSAAHPACCLDRCRGGHRMTRQSGPGSAWKIHRSTQQRRLVDRVSRLGHPADPAVEQHHHACGTLRRAARS